MVVDVGTNNVAISKFVELAAAKDDELFVLEELEWATEDGVGSADMSMEASCLDVAISELGPVSESFCGQPDEVHGSMEQQPANPFELHV